MFSMTYSTKNTHFGHLIMICMMYSVKYTQSILLTLIRVEYDANYTIYSFDHEQLDVRCQIYTLSWFNQDQNVVRHQKCNIPNWPWSKWFTTSNTSMYRSGSSGQVLGSMPTEQIGTMVKCSRLNERIVHVCVLRLVPFTVSNIEDTYTGIYLKYTSWTVKIEYR